MLYNVAHPYTIAKTLMVRLCAVDIDTVESYVHSWALRILSHDRHRALWLNMHPHFISPGRRPRPMDHDNDATMTDMVPKIFTCVFAIMRAVQREMVL